MRTTLNIEEELLRKEANLTGIREETSLVRLGLEALIARRPLFSVIIKLIP